jgi:hypothetical protein
MATSGCSIVGVHHPRKPDRDAGNTSLDRANITDWFDRSRGPRSLINNSDSRLGVDRPSPGTVGVDLVVRGFERVRGEIPAIHIVRENHEDGEPWGYSRLTGVQLLGNTTQETVFRGLPNDFRFKEAVQAYGKADQATRDFLLKCISAGILSQTGKGRYQKIEQNTVSDGGGGGVTGGLRDSAPNLSYVN